MYFNANNLKSDHFEKTHVCAEKWIEIVVQTTSHDPNRVLVVLLWSCIYRYEVW
jgi:hypothetical protein